MSTQECIYCGCSFDPSETPAEHVILNAFGGKRKSKEVVCGTCNTFFSQNVDKEMPESLALLRAILGVPRSNPPTGEGCGVRSSFLVSPSFGTQLDLFGFRVGYAHGDD